MTTTPRKYVRRSKAVVNLNWIDEETHGAIIALWQRERKEARPPVEAIVEGHFHDRKGRKYAFGREVTRDHGNGFSYNHVELLVNHEENVLQLYVRNYQSNKKAKATFPLTEIPRDPCAFFEAAKKKLVASYMYDLGTLSFNRKSVEELWADFQIGLEFLPKYEVEKMHEMTDYDS